jgi:hypothetical protein
VLICSTIVLTVCSACQAEACLPWTFKSAPGCSSIGCCACWTGAGSSSQASQAALLTEFQHSKSHTECPGAEIAGSPALFYCLMQGRP